MVNCASKLLSQNFLLNTEHFDVVEIRKDVGLSSCDGKMVGHIKQSGVCGSDDRGAVWEFDVDAVIGGTAMH
jgi:hypothetical protein